MKKEILEQTIPHKDRAMAFAEWIDVNAVRTNEHEWTWRGDNFKDRYTTSVLWDIFTQLPKTQ